MVIDFTFDIVDVYAAGAHRVKVTSSSDHDGEWVAMSEVASETDSRPGPASGLFRGEAALSPDGAASGSGDGTVWVQPGDTLAVTYFQADGITPIATHQVQVESPAPASLPAADWLALSILAGARWLRRSPTGRR